MCVGIAQDRKGTLRTCKHAISGWRLRLRLQVFDNYVVRIHRQLALRMQPRQLMGNQFKCAHVLCMPRGCLKNSSESTADFVGIRTKECEASEVRRYFVIACANCSFQSAID
jgi:hypothetical protein